MKKISDGAWSQFNKERLIRSVDGQRILDDSLDACNEKFIMSFLVLKYKKELAQEARKLLKERKEEEK